MAFTAAQQAKIDAAVKRNDIAKENWKNAVDWWNTHFVNLACYKDTKYDALAAATWFTPNDSSCTGFGGGMNCTNSQKQTCKSEIALVISKIGNIRADYTEYIAAQANYDKVFGEVSAEVKADPTLIAQLAGISAGALANKQKWIFAGIVIVVVGFLIFAYFKWFRK